MNPDELDKLIKRLQADVSSSVLETMLQEAAAGDTTTGGGLLTKTDEGYMSHTHYGWLLVQEHDGKRYLLIEDREENLHAIECVTQPDVEFWSRLLGMDTEAEHDDTRPDEPEDEEDGDDVHVIRDGGGAAVGITRRIATTGQFTFNFGSHITLSDHCEEEHPS